MINNIRKLRKEQGLTLKRLSELRGVKGELYGCDAEIFKETYEKVEG